MFVRWINWVKHKTKFLALSATLAVAVLSASASATDYSNPSPIPNAEVKRAVFTTAVENREPTDEVITLENTVTSINFFTELRGLGGRTVTHRWEHEGKVITEVQFQVGGDRWRVYSKKSLIPSMLGKWTVVVVDQTGWPLHASIFEYVQAR